MDITLKPHYTALVQKPFCCNVTCLQMILYRRGYGLFDQEQLAKFFKIKVSAEAKKSFNVKLGTYTRINLDEGLVTIKSAPIVNRFLKKNRLPLTATSVRASEIGDLQSFIASHLKADDDLWIEYKSHQIHGERIIHDNVIESIKTRAKDKDTGVVLVDPQGTHKTRLEVSLGKIRAAISTKFGRETGFLVISKRRG